MTAWDTATIGAVCSTYSGGTPSTARPEYYGGDIPWIASAELNQGRISSVKGRISKLGLDRSSAKLVGPGTPLIALYGATAGVPAIADIGGAINQAVLAMVPKGIDAEFLYQWLKANRHEISDRYTQGGQPNLSGAIVRSIEVPLPPAPEQRRIASSLREADDLLAGLERMIAKKQAIKQALMQQLLTGKTRLPGFTDQWVAGVSVADVARRFAGYWGSAPGDLEVEARIIRAGDVGSAHRITGYARRSLTRSQYERARCRPGDVVLTASGTIGNVALIVSDAFVASNFVRVLRPGDRLMGEFLYYALQSFRASTAMVSHLGVSAMPNLGSGFYADAFLDIPALSEQRAIVQVLSDADREIDALGARLAKAQEMKQGMMQELLTGRTRLRVEGNRA